MCESICHIEDKKRMNCPKIKNCNSQNNIISSSNLTEIPQDSRNMNILKFIRIKHYYCRINYKFQNNINNKITNFSRLSFKLGISRRTLIRISRKKDYWTNIPTLLLLAKLLHFSKKEVISNISFIKTRNSMPLEFSLQNLFSPSFFRILGHIIGDGGIQVNEKEKKYRAFYTNKKENLLTSFIQDVKIVFGNIKVYYRSRKKRASEVWLPTTLGLIIYELFEYEKQNKKKRVPKFIFQTKNKSILGCFLQAIYDDDGFLYPDKRMIVLSQKSKELISDIRKVVQKLGIKPNKLLVHKSKTRTTMHYFSITHKNNFKLFDKFVGFQHPNKKEKLKLLIYKKR